MKPSETPWRTLIRFEALDNVNEHALIIVPAWDSSVIIRIPKVFIPADILLAVEQGEIRHYAHVNVGADYVTDLVFSKWELGCTHVWGTDGQHSNEYCKKCFVSKN